MLNYLKNIASSSVRVVLLLKFYDLNHLSNCTPKLIAMMELSHEGISVSERITASSSVDSPGENEPEHVPLSDHSSTYQSDEENGSGTAEMHQPPVDPQPTIEPEDKQSTSLLEGSEKATNRDVK